MQVDCRKAGEVHILELEGQLVAGTGDQALHRTINELVAEQATKILVNLAGVTRLDSSGLGELVASAQLAKRFGTAMRFVKPGAQVLRVLEIAQILPALEVHDSEEDALAAFA